MLSDYGVQGSIVEIRPGPVVTLYELEPAPGIRSARVIGLADDVARSLSVTAVRIATVPGRNVIGIEVPNAKRETVFLSEILSSDELQKHAGRLTLALGKDISGAPMFADLARMPHLMIAGTTGSGKSVGVNAMILSLLYRLSPDQCRLILIDPKMLELSMYEGIPHLMAPVVTEPAKAVTALKWTVREMERRYRAMSQLGVRNIAGYNDRVAEARAKGEVVTRRVQTGFDPDTGRPTFEDQPLTLEPLPLIVVVVDEMADLMMVAGKEIEAAVQRLAQMARAAGIHVIMATQRPSVDVITGTIKANFPDAHQLPGDQQVRQPHHPGRAGRGAAARHGRHAVHGGWRAHHPRAWAVRVGRGGGEGGGVPARAGRAGLSWRKSPSRRMTTDGDAIAGAWARRATARRGLYRAGGRGGGARGQGEHQLHPAASEHRLQPRGQADRADGEGGRGRAGQPCRQARGADPAGGGGGLKCGGCLTAGPPSYTNPHKQ